MSDYFRGLSERERSAFFARLAQMAYDEPGVVIPAFYNFGFNSEYIAKEDAELYVLQSRTDIIVACRGTQPRKIRDIKTNLQIWPRKNPNSPEGLVHLGFNSYVNKVWREVAAIIIASPTKSVWFTGHSLGAAMASIMAVYCQVNPILNDPVGLFTFGSPRTGTKEFVKQGRAIYHERWVNNIDIVTRVPFALLGYRHFGTEMYLNHWGNYRRVTSWQKIKDRWRGFIVGLKSKKSNHLRNHSMENYLANIESWRDDRENTQA